MKNTKKIIFILAVVIAVVLLQRQPVSQETDVDTIGWVTFRSEKYGFELKYPSDWTIETSPVVGGKDVINIYPPYPNFDDPWDNLAWKQLGIMIRFPEDIDKYLAKEINNRQSGGSITTTEEIIFNGMQAILLTTKNAYYENGTVHLKGKVYNYVFTVFWNFPTSTPFIKPEFKISSQARDWERNSLMMLKNIFSTFKLL